MKKVKIFIGDNGESIVGLPLCYLKYILYVLFVFFDLLTTYLTSPDLRYEGNYIVKYIFPNWNLLLCIVISLVISIILSNIWALKYLNSNAKKSKAKVILSSIALIVFYTHFLYTLFVVPNNILVNVYYNGTRFQLLKTLTHSYVNAISHKGTTIYFVYFILLLVTVFSIFLVLRNIKKCFSGELYASDEL